MRLNIYSEELTKEVRLVETVDRDGIAKHFGIRIYLASPGMLHNTPDDDDRSAVTFWIPNCGSFTPCDLASVFDDMAALAMGVEERLAKEGG